MLKRQQDQVYFLCVRFTNFILGKEHLKQIDRNSFIYALISKESVTPMFISEFTDVAKFDSPVKCFIYQNKISLSDNSVFFSVKLSDLNPKNTFCIKIYLLKHQREVELTNFKFFVNKYIEVQQLEGIKYTQENFFQKSGARIQAQVFIDKNRAALQMLILEINDQKKKRQSLEARKKREEKRSLQKTGNNLTIEKLYEESKEEKNLIKTIQRAEIKKSTQQLKRKRSNLSQLSSDQSGLADPEINVKKVKGRPAKQTQKRDKSLITSRKVNNKHNKLDISRISEVINSQNGSDPDKGNMLQGFSREREKLRGSEYRKKSESSDPILQKLDLSQKNTKKPLSVMTQEIVQESSIFTGENKKVTEQASMKESMSSMQSIDGQLSQSLSRSFIEAVELDSQDSKLTHSSEESGRSEVQLLVQRRNKLFWILLIGFASFAIYFLMVPNGPKRGKTSIKRGKHKN